jgi:hypothetical protein
MKLKFLVLIPVLLVFFSCTIYLPYSFEDDEGPYRIILSIDPDDAQVLLNGKLIGDAYEFSTLKTAIRLQSRNNSLIIKKTGYIEEFIDLKKFSDQTITLEIQMKKDQSMARTESPKPARTIPSEKIKNENIPMKERAENTIAKETTPDISHDSTEDKIADMVTIQMEIYPEEASIYINSRFFGIVPSDNIINNVRLKPDRYLLEIVKPGFQSYRKELDLTKPEKPELVIKLQKTN